MRAIYLIVILVALAITAGVVLYYNSIGEIADIPTPTPTPMTEETTVKHSVPLEEIEAGGPAKDGIPSIDDPKFISPSEGDEFLSDNEVGQGLCIGDDCRFYPYQILVWHEIVNDTVGGEPVLVTYCPLCMTGIVFQRKLDGQQS
jgi:hypothetical protein